MNLHELRKIHTTTASVLVFRQLFDHVLEGRTLELETTVLVGPISQLIFSLLLHPYTDSPSPKNKNGVYQTVKKIEDTITRFDTTHGRDRQQDGQTDRRTSHDGIGSGHA